MALYRLCPHCKIKVEYGTKCQCEIDIQKNRHNTYKKYRTDKIEQEFYNSKLWLQAKEMSKLKTNGMDVYEYYINNRVIAGDVVHHIVEIKECWDKRLDVSNLIYLSNSNHQLIHRLMDKSNEDKVEIQELLMGLLDRFNKEFKDGE